MTGDELTAAILADLGDLADEATLYPVRAANLEAYLAGDGAGSTLSGVLEVRAATADGEVGIAVELVTFTTTATAAAAIEPRAACIRADGVLFDVIRKARDYPGAVVLILQEVDE